MSQHVEGRGPAEDEPQVPSEGERQIDRSTLRRGKRRRKKLSEEIAKDPLITGSLDMLIGQEEGEFFHRLVLKGKRLTHAGGPAREVLRLLERITHSLEALVPTATPHLGVVRGHNSIEVTFYAPEDEIEAARLRQAATLPRAVPLTFAEKVEALPDTAIAVIALSEILSQPDPKEAAFQARRVSQQVADEIRELTWTIVDEDVTLEVPWRAPGEFVAVTPDWSLRVVEELDAAEELKPVRVRVFGVLQGANSGGKGRFELVTDEYEELPPELGPRRKPGSKISGELTPRARKEIREQNLWDTHVEATVEVSRRRLRDRVYADGFTLVSVNPWS